MAIKIAFVDSNGEIRSILSPGVDDMYVNGQIYGDYTAHHIADGEDPSVFMDTKYYDYIEQQFVNRPSRPSFFHYWDVPVKLWRFDYTRAMEYIRDERTKRLTNTDWTQVSDNSLSEEKREEWKLYRQELRDLPGLIPSTISHIDQVSWPTEPV